MDLLIRVSVCPFQLRHLDDSRLLKDLFRRYYGRLAVIPGTYAKDPFILTGSYLLLRRIASICLLHFIWGLLLGFDDVPPSMDTESIQTTGREALWPLFDAREQLSEWLDFNQLERDYQTLMHSREDIRPLRRLQSCKHLPIDWLI